MTVCLCVSSFLMHASFQRTWTKFGIYHLHVLRMITRVFSEAICNTRQPVYDRLTPFKLLVYIKESNTILLFLKSDSFYHVMLCIRGTGHGAVSVCPSVYLSITSRSSAKTAKRRITQTSPHNSPGTLVFWCQRSPLNSTGVTPYGGAKCRWGGSKSRLSTNNRLHLDNGTR